MRGSTVRKEADAGRIAISVREADGERLFEPIDALLFAVNRRFKLEAVDAVSASQLAEAIAKTTDVVAAAAFPLIQAFAAGCDEPGQRAIGASLIQKIHRPFNPFAYRS